MLHTIDDDEQHCGLTALQNSPVPSSASERFILTNSFRGTHRSKADHAVRHQVAAGYCLAASARQLYNHNHETRSLSESTMHI